jgi:hypothetical protein
MTQHSEQWFKARMGRATASQFNRIITTVRGDLSSARHDYIHELLGQRFAPYEAAKFTGSYWTDRGNELEGEARTMFEQEMGVTIGQVGFITAEQWGHVVGCSPDGLVLSEDSEQFVGGLEIKCLMAKNHVAIWDAEQMPGDYKQQVHGSMAVTGLDHWWFMSYHPAMRPFYQKIERDDYTELLAERLDEFIEEYGQLSDKLAPRLKPLTNQDLL